MQVPLEISYRGLEKTEDIESLVLQQVAKLEKICNYIISCHVAVDQTSKRHQVGNPYRVRIDVRVPPAHDLVVDRRSPVGDAHIPLPALLRDSFDSVQRQLQDLMDKQRGEVKAHPEQEVTALVSRLLPEEGYGFIQAVDGREVYFHRNSVLHNHWPRLKVGSGVRFTEEMGEKGPQATTVELLDKAGPRLPKGAKLSPPVS
ncbi:MAG: HPF/RaiA family ribosome-associated protein [Chloroflexi bacterium]|nr:HPF/RaiA family ribosome-associated protein [Chloroflexota bacterium]